MPNLQANLDSLLENEALTSDLDDDAANVLLEWSMSHVRLIHRMAVDEPDPDEYIAQQMKATRKWMRTVNRWTPARADKDSASNSATLTEILALIGNSKSPERQAEFLTVHLSDPPPEFIAHLCSFCEKG